MCIYIYTYIGTSKLQGLPIYIFCNQNSALRKFALSPCTHQVASKFVNNDSYLFAIDSTDLCKDMDMMGMQCPFHFPPGILSPGIFRM